MSEAKILDAAGGKIAVKANIEPGVSIDNPLLMLNRISSDTETIAKNRFFWNSTCLICIKD